MTYWVIHERETDGEETEFQGELFDTYVEAFVYSKVQQADRGHDAAVYEAYECAIPDCGTVPEWGLEFCETCREAASEEETA